MTDQYCSRLEGVVSEQFHRKTVLQVGCGAGSTAAVFLARMGIGRLVLADHDVVEIENLCRTAYRVQDLGSKKTEALREIIADANPAVEVSTCSRDICTLSPAETADLLAGVDLLIAGTDQFRAQALINIWSQQHRIPALFIGLHAGGAGGRIVWTVPGETCCYRCISTARYEAKDEKRDLNAEHASLLDAVFVDTIAMRAAAAILDRSEPSRMGMFFTHMGGRNEIVIRAHPDHPYTAAVRSHVREAIPSSSQEDLDFLESNLQCALDSLWLHGHKNPDCPDCAGR